MKRNVPANQLFDFCLWYPRILNLSANKPYLLLIFHSLRQKTWDTGGQLNETGHVRGPGRSDRIRYLKIAYESAGEREFVRRKSSTAHYRRVASNYSSMYYTWNEICLIFNFTCCALRSLWKKLVIKLNRLNFRFKVKWRKAWIFVVPWRAVKLSPNIRHRVYFSLSLSLPLSSP